MSPSPKSAYGTDLGADFFCFDFTIYTAARFWPTVKKISKLALKMDCCEAPELSILHFLVLNESLEHYLNAILQKFCPKVNQFLRPR